MKQFVFHGVDRADGADLRAATRSAHIAYQAVRSNPVGGPLLNANGAPCGTLIIFDAPDLETAAGFVAGDPYVVAGLFASTTVHEFHAVDWPS